MILQIINSNVLYRGEDIEHLVPEMYAENQRRKKTFICGDRRH